MQQYQQQLQDEQFTDKGSMWPFLKRLFSYAVQHKKWFWGFIVSVIIVGLSDAIFPLIWMYFLDNIITPLVNTYSEARAQGISPVLDLNGVYFYVALFFINAIIQVVGVFFFIKFAGNIQEYVMYELREQMFNKLQRLAFSYYDKSASGWLLSRLSSDTERVTELISWGFLDVIWGITMIIACMGAMFFYNWKLALIILLAIPVLVVVSIKIRLLILKYSRLARKLNSEVTANYNEHINGVEVNKITAQEERVSAAFRLLSNDMRKASFSASFYTAMYMPLVIFIGSAAAALILYAGGKMAIAVPAGITVGILAAFFSYATLIFMPILDIARFYAMAQGSLSAGERIFSLIDEKVDIKDGGAVGTFDKIKGDIHFDHIDFEYVKDKPVLQNFNLYIKAGQSIALVGATGEGKSTIANLVCRFYEPTKGVLYIDGKDYKQQSLHSFRSQLGVVLQSPHLFSGSIRDNVKYGIKTASDEEIIHALKVVGADHFIDKLDETVGEGGDKLSMGEQQLISFARALIKQPRILIMDEATSSIDTLTEAKIQKGIEKMIEGRTSIIIAHRLSTIKNCDRILVIQKGRIIEDGNHRELIKLKGHYYELYTKQLKREVITTDSDKVALEDS